MIEIIIVAGGEIDDDLLECEIKNANKPYIIGVDKGIEALDRINAIPDMVIGDFDSADRSIKEEYITKYKSIILNPIKDETDTHVAVLEALKLDDPEKKIIILGATGGRMDHFLGNLALLRLCLDKDVRNAYILDSKNRIRIIKDYCCIKKAEAYGKFISLIPFTDKAEGITLEGFKYNLRDGVLLKDETRGISNEIIKEEGHIRIKSGYLLLLETKD